MRWIEEGELALPDFQRDFVWDPNRVVDLLDSTSHGWPIGSLLMLEGPQPFGLKAISNGPPVNEGDVRWYLLDGQQRLTSLYLATLDLGDVVYYVDLSSTDEHEEYPFLWATRDRYAAAESQFTFQELVNDRAFSERLEALPSRLLERYSQAREERMGPLLETYEIPAIVMSSDIPLEALTRIFETLNRTGVRLNAFDLMVAVLRRYNFMLRDEWQTALENYPALAATGADGVEILKLVALWQRDVDVKSSRPSARKVRGVRQGDVLNIPGEFVHASWSRAVATYARVIEILLDKAGIRGNRSMPSWAMILPMAYWLDAGYEPDLIIRWYWQTVALQTYAQGANTQVIADLANQPGQIPADIVKASIGAALADQNRRNRVLRLAIRGLAIRRAQESGVSSISSSATGREISVEGLRRNEISAAGTDALGDLVYLPTREISRLRKLITSVPSLLLEVEPAILEVQGFDTELLQNPDALRQKRTKVLTSWIGELS